MRVLVTGHHGYIGSVTAPFLAAAGHEVVGLDTFFYRGCDFGAGGPASFDGRDVRDVSPAWLEGLDAVVHLAALSNDPIGDLNEQWTYDINRDGAVALARAARDAGVPRFVLASSCSMYGASGTDDALDESAPLRPLTAYAASKVRAEEEIARLAGPGFAPVFMRNATAYGVSPRLRLDIVLNNLAAWAHTAGRVRLLSDGLAVRPIVHIEDISRATLALLEAPAGVVSGEAFNIGTDAQNYRVRDLAAIVQSASGCEVEIAGGATSDPRSYRVDFSKLARAFPDLELVWTAERGARELLDAYREVGLTAELFEGHRYIRLNQIKRLLADGRLDDTLRFVDGPDERAA